MADYKELIADLRYCFYDVDIVLDAADAIEQLVKERDASVDAVPVVRCKDCKHRGTDDCPMHYKGVPADEDFLKKVDNDFCSYGERKGSDER